ncbi:acyl carrier protein [Streptomyces sp. WZ.A104]|uniref:Acyl carrier protein n=1 Tax=Streptomyces durocortorensis TaxID=2811104 RepID=A0ABY9W0J2_9ACTN|nr:MULTISPECIES: acyl carrier protein [Streptomyces]PCG84420.1 acyl carrier protein [Streptomyces sp. WZ.A104]WNF29660.1 acyl carrier protein [Streptomyces durocortorensis]
MSEAIDNKIAAILKQVAELPDSFEVKAEQDLKADLEIDSLKLIDVVVLVEAELDIEIGDEFAGQIVTVADLQRQVDSLVAG